MVGEYEYELIIRIFDNSKFKMVDPIWLMTKKNSFSIDYFAPKFILQVYKPSWAESYRLISHSPLS